MAKLHTSKSMANDKSGMSQRTESMNPFKALGKKLKGHSDHILNGGSKAGSPEKNGRDRASSLASRRIPPGGHHPHVLKTAESSPALQNMMAHNHNPFAHANPQLSHARGPLRRRTHTSGKKNNSPRNGSHPERMVYNPYGLNNSHSGTAQGGAMNNGGGRNDLSFYMHDGDAHVRVLPLPIADPNAYLPDDMKQISISLTDNFVFDSDNQALGSGGSSEVRKIRSSHHQRDVYALKKLNMIYDETPEKFYKRCSKEFIIGKRLSHNIHVANTYCVVKVPTTTYTTRGWGFVIEICERDLFQLMERSGWRGVPLPEKYCLFKQIAEGVKFCHSQGIAHRDLKPENVLLTHEGVCKLTDFGISDWYHTDPADPSSPVKRCEGMIGSSPYAPPEVMMYDAKKCYPESLQKPFDPLKMDTYALGIILLALVQNMLPFLESCDVDSRYREYAAGYEQYVQYQNPHFRDKGCHRPGPGSEYLLARNFNSSDATRVAWRLADPNAATRYTMEDLYDDPWFQSIETCVDPDEPPNLNAPDLRGPRGQSEESLASSKPRSMVDIAETPSQQQHQHGAAHVTRKMSELSMTSAGSPPAQQQSVPVPQQNSSASLRSNASRAKKRRVVHNHMDVPASVAPSASARAMSSR